MSSRYTGPTVDPAGRYLAQLGMGWEVRSGFSISTCGPVPETGNVDIIAVAYPDGQPVSLPTEPFPSEYLTRWRGYSLDMHGQPALDPEHPREPVWQFPQNDGPLQHPIELVRLRVQAAGSHLYAELIALPIPGRPIRTGLFGWNEIRPRRIPPPGEIEKAIHALELLGIAREWLETRPAHRPRLEHDPGWRAAMREIDAYLKKPSTSLNSAVVSFWDYLVREIDDDDLDAEALGEDIDAKRKRAALAKLKNWRSRWKKLPESKKRAEFT